MEDKNSHTLRSRRIALIAAAVIASCSGRESLLAPSAPSDLGKGSTGARDRASVPSAASPAIILDGSSSGPTVGADVYGTNLNIWYDFTQAWVKPSLANANMRFIRWPGGSNADLYHWENGGSLCQNGYLAKNVSFDNLMTLVAQPLVADVAITLNYGSNPSCTGGGDPSEAASWVAYAKDRGYASAKYWTVGNEVYGSWEYDLHTLAHDPHTYATAVRTGYYPEVKAANSQAHVGVVGDFALPGDKGWNRIVFREARPFDFIEIHYYPQNGTDDDAYLLGAAVTTLSTDLAALRSQMVSAGLPGDFPVYLGEFNSDANKYLGKQSVSIVNGLYAGQVLGTIEAAGIQMSTFWEGYGNCSQGGDFSKSLYGWQNFGSQAEFSDGLPEYGCYDAPAIPASTPFPPARVIALLASEVPPGSSVRSVTVPTSLGTTVRAFGYAVKHGYALVLYNNTLSSVKVTVRVENTAMKHFRATVITYGKRQYDLSQANQWIGPVSEALGRISSSVKLMLGPYSVTVLKLRSV